MNGEFDDPEHPEAAHTRRRIQLAFLGLFLVVAIGCADPFAGQYTNANVSKPDVVEGVPLVVGS